MKKIFSFCFFYIIFLNLIFSAEPKTINQNNEYNGITLEYNLSTDEPQYKQFTKVQVFYDNSNNKRKEIYYLSETLQKNNGYLTQTNIFNEGKIVEYVVQLTEEEAAKKGVSILIEKMDANNTCYSLGFSNGKLTAYTSSDSFMNNYQLFALDYLENQIYSSENEKKQNNQYLLSAKYFKARTFVKVKSPTTDMSKKDKEIVYYYSKFLNDPDKASLYNKKIKVESKGKQYTAFVQDSLIPYLKTPYLTEDGDCLLAYGVLGYDDELFLIAIDFAEVQ